MSNVLVTAIGSFSSDIAINNLKQKGHCVIGADIYPAQWEANSLFVDKFYRVPLATKSDLYLEKLKQICIDEKIGFIIPSTDAEIDVLNENRDYFESCGIVLCISPYDTVKLCRNKYELYKHFADSKIASVVIPTALVSECEECPFEYPVVCKPLNGRSSSGLSVGYSREDWDAIKKSGDSLMLVQQKINGNVIAVDVVRNSKGDIVSIAREELLRTLNGAGTSVRVFRDKKLDEYCIELANSLGVIGCVCFEFILSESGDFYFLECNPRFAGGVAFSCFAGYDCINNHLSCFTTGEIEKFVLDKEIFIARKYKEYITEVNNGEFDISNSKETDI